MASGVRRGVVADVVIAIVDGGVVVLCEVVQSRTRNHRRDQCLVSGGVMSNAHAPANESVPTMRTTTSNTVLKAAKIMSVRE